MGRVKKEGKFDAANLLPPLCVYGGGNLEKPEIKMEGEGVTMVTKRDITTPYCVCVCVLARVVGQLYTAKSPPPSLLPPRGPVLKGGGAGGGSIDTPAAVSFHACETSMSHPNGPSDTTLGYLFAISTSSRHPSKLFQIIQNNKKKLRQPCPRKP